MWRLISTCLCGSLQVRGSLLLTVQQQHQAKVSNWDGRSQSLEGHAADNFGGWTQRDLRTKRYPPHYSPGVLQLKDTTHYKMFFQKPQQTLISGYCSMTRTAAAKTFFFPPNIMIHIKNDWERTFQVLTLTFIP